MMIEKCPYCDKQPVIMRPFDNRFIIWCPDCCVSVDEKDSFVNTIRCWNLKVKTIKEKERGK